MAKTMLEQFHELKEKHPTAIILFHCGDFYETYEDDAQICANVLGITLTKRTSDGTRMAGFPHHALDAYLPKLVRYVNQPEAIMKRIVISDQLEDPRLTKKLVKRGSTETTFEGYHAGDFVYSKKHGKNMTIFMAHREQRVGEEPRVTRYTFSDMTSATPDEVEDAH